LVVICAWRLQSDEKVLCSSTSPSAAFQTRSLAINDLVGALVSEVHLDEPAGDLQLVFSNGLRLFILQTKPMKKNSTLIICSKCQIRYLKMHRIVFSRSQTNSKIS